MRRLRLALFFAVLATSLAFPASALANHTTWTIYTGNGSQSLTLTANWTWVHHDGYWWKNITSNDAYTSSGTCTLHCSLNTMGIGSFKYGVGTYTQTIGTTDKYYYWSGKQGCNYSANWDDFTEDVWINGTYMGVGASFYNPDYPKG